MTSATLPNTPSTEPATTTRGTDPVVKAVGLTKVFRDFWMRQRVCAVDRVDLEVHRGEVFGLLGPNGSGKSTTIKMLLGLLHPTAGRVLVLGKQPQDVATKRQIGYLPEESYLYRFLNAQETLDYCGQLFGLPRRVRRQRTDTLLEMVGLQAVRHRPVGEYSKGMQRRLGLAQALINDPQLLILDEPTSGLDPIGTRQFKDLLLELARRGKTVLLCSHLLADVEDVCQRVAIMFGGRIRTVGTVDHLLVRQDVTTIQTQSLDAHTLEQIDALLQSCGRYIESVDRPRLKLESLFLDIVRQAQNEGLATSGAAPSGRIASFLIEHDGNHAAAATKLPDDASSAALIETLVHPASGATATPTGAGTQTAPTLTPCPGQPAPSPAPAAPSTPQPPETDQPDRTLIDSLSARTAAPNHPATHPDKRSANRAPHHSPQSDKPDHPRSPP